MAMISGTAVRDAFKERFGPAMKTLDRNLHGIRHAVADGRRATADMTEQAVRQVKRHPGRALGLAAAKGAAIGCLVGFALGRRRRR
jgi:ElaB/YqjD/DUF883 family membrane-anchored ribosome-binding protein